MSLNKKFFIGGAAGITATEHFAPVIYTGNGSTQSISSLSFAPDLIWFKDRSSSSENNWLFDVLRGTNIGLSSNLTGGNYTLTNTLNSFDTNGFTVGLDGKVNRSSDNYVAWAWKAAGSSSTFNIIENGSLSTGSTASSVGISETGANATLTSASINRDSGFGIITNTITTSGYPQVLSHGFGSEPDLIINKPTTTSEGWLVKVNESVFGSTYDKQLVLNTTAAATDVTNSSRQITSIHTNATYTPNPQSFVSYIFKSVEGFSKIGSYTGNGTSVSSTNTITTGFQPRWIMFKCTTAADQWIIFDNTRGTVANITDTYLLANLSQAESDLNDGNQVEFLSNGFKITGNGRYFNQNSETYIYLAIA